MRNVYFLINSVVLKWEIHANWATLRRSKLSYRLWCHRINMNTKGKHIIEVVPDGYHRCFFGVKVKTVTFKGGRRFLRLLYMPAQIIQMIAFTQIIDIWTPGITLWDQLKDTWYLWGKNSKNWQLKNILVCNSAICWITG